MATQKMDRSARCAQTKARNAVRRAERRRKAEGLLTERAKRTTVQQLNRLIDGGLSARKERARLESLIRS